MGIDGYSSSAVEQIGTEHDYRKGKQAHYAWFEMYPRASYEIVGFPVRPGDVISASVVYAGSNIFTLTLHNVTRNVATIVPNKYTLSTTAKRSSAEWIVEAPYLNGILPLSNFGTAHLLGCTATINGITASLKNGSWPKIAIEMVTNSNVPKAIPSAVGVDNQSFTVAWAHKGPVT